MFVTFVFFTLVYFPKYEEHLLSKEVVRETHLYKKESF